MKVKRPERAVDPADWKRHMNRRLRAEFIAGAEEQWLKRTGRPMSSSESYDGTRAISSAGFTCVATRQVARTLYPAPRFHRQSAYQHPGY
jgi:hypothetical protein